MALVVDQSLLQRANAKLRAGKKREEVARLRKLIQTAEKLDPRIARIKEEERAEKQRIKDAKKARKNKTVAG